jgi:hypothetical protein
MKVDDENWHVLTVLASRSGNRRIHHGEGACYHLVADEERARKLSA